MALNIQPGTTITSINENVVIRSFTTNTSDALMYESFLSFFDAVNPLGFYLIDPGWFIIWMGNVRQSTRNVFDLHRTFHIL